MAEEREIEREEKRAETCEVHMIQTIITFRNATEIARFLAAFHHVHRPLAVAAVPLGTGTGTCGSFPTTFIPEALTAIAFVCTLPRYKERERKVEERKRKFV